MNGKVVWLLAAVIGVACAYTSTRSPFTASECEKALLECTKTYTSQTTDERYYLEQYYNCINSAYQCDDNRVTGYQSRQDLINNLRNQISNWDYYHSYASGASSTGQSVVALVTSLLVTVKILRA